MCCHEPIPPGKSALSVLDTHCAQDELTTCLKVSCVEYLSDSEGKKIIKKRTRRQTNKYPKSVAG